MNIYYLEIVSNDVEKEVAILERVQGLSFGEPVPALGGARVGTAATGGLVGVRPPMRSDEMPVVRPYFLVENLDETITGLAALGAEIALPRMELEGYGVIGIYIANGIQYGLWQN